MGKTPRSTPCGDEGLLIESGGREGTVEVKVVAADALPDISYSATRDGPPPGELLEYPLMFTADDKQEAISLLLGALPSEYTGIVAIDDDNVVTIYSNAGYPVDGIQDLRTHEWAELRQSGKRIDVHKVPRKRIEQYIATAASKKPRE